MVAQLPYSILATIICHKKNVLERYVKLYVSIQEGANMRASIYALSFLMMLLSTTNHTWPWPEMMKQFGGGCCLTHSLDTRQITFSPLAPSRMESNPFVALSNNVLPSAIRYRLGFMTPCASKAGMISVWSFSRSISFLQ